MQLNLTERTLCPFLLVWCGSLVSTGCVSTTGQADNTLEHLNALTSLFEGHFDTHTDSFRPTDKVTRFSDSRQRAIAPSIGSHVFYLQLNRGDELTLYRQRILTLSINDSTGHIEQKSYTLRNPERFLNAKSGDSVLSNLSIDDIQPMFSQGCEQVFEKTANGFYGHVNPKTCRIYSERRKKIRRIEAETWITADTLKLAERGFDDDMNQEFGTKPGEFTLLYRVQQ